MGLTRSYRDIVQLGEHLHDAQEVGGSKPSVPIRILAVFMKGRKRNQDRFLGRERPFSLEIDYVLMRSNIFRGAPLTY